LGQVRRAVLRVVGFSLLLAVVLEALLIVVAVTTGSPGGGVPFLVDLAGKVPWAVFTCTGIWLGLELGAGRPLLGALAGLIAAPLASLLLRAVAEGFHALALTGVPSGPSPLTVAAIKGVEYACLGGLIGLLGRRTWVAFGHHAAAGLAVAIPFGGALLVLSASSSPEPLGLGTVLAWGVNELLFPVGCALVLFSAARVEREHDGPAAASRGAVRRSG
jgi:hypothetical protein